MDILLDTRRSAAGGDHADHALLQAVAGTGPDWTVFRDCALADGHHGAPARVRYALLHPEVGIALLDVLPGATAQRGPERLRALLDAAAFRPAFGDYPPIIHLCLPWRSLLRLGALMEQRFALLPPLALAGGDAWVGAAQRVLTAGPPLRLPGHAAAGKPPLPSRLSGQERVEGRPAPRAAFGSRGLAMFWGVVALAFGGGALVLQALGPPEGSLAVAYAGRTGPDELQVTQAAPEGWPAPSDPGKARPPSPGPTIALSPAVRMPALSDSVRAGAAAPDTGDDASGSDPRPGGDHPARAEPAAPVLPKSPPVSGHGPTADHLAFAAKILAGVEAVGSSAGAADTLPRLAPGPGTAPPAGDAGVRGAPAPDLEALSSGPRLSLPNAPAQPEATGGPGKAPAAPAREGNTRGGTAGPAEDPNRPVGGTRASSGSADATGAPAGGLLSPAGASGTGAAEPAQAGRNSPGEPPASTPPGLAGALIARGDAMVARRDISAARLFYERAAAVDARAASALARTYDPAFLAEVGARGVQGDTALAAAWFRRAVALGDSGALARVEALNGPDRAVDRRP